MFADRFCINVILCDVFGHIVKMNTLGCRRAGREGCGNWGRVPLESKSLAAKEVPVCTSRLTPCFLSSMRLMKTPNNDEQGFVHVRVMDIHMHQ
jgi:hypothetical protein